MENFIDQIIEAIQTLLFRFLLFPIEELIENAPYSIPTIIFSYLIGLTVYLFVNKRYDNKVTWRLVGAITAMVTANLRFWIVGLSVDFRSFLVMNILFGLSGYVAGNWIAQKSKLNILHSGIIGISLGVLYNIFVSVNWWVLVFPGNVILFYGKFTAPILYTRICYFIAWSGYKSFQQGYRQGHGKAE